MVPNTPGEAGDAGPPQQTCRVEKRESCVTSYGLGNHVSQQDLVHSSSARITGQGFPSSEIRSPCCPWWGPNAYQFPELVACISLPHGGPGTGAAYLSLHKTGSNPTAAREMPEKNPTTGETVPTRNIVAAVRFATLLFPKLRTTVLRGVPAGARVANLWLHPIEKYSSLR